MYRICVNTTHDMCLVLGGGGWRNKPVHHQPYHLTAALPGLWGLCWLLAEVEIICNEES